MVEVHKSGAVKRKRRSQRRAAAPVEVTRVHPDALALAIEGIRPDLEFDQEVATSLGLKSTYFNPLSRGIDRDEIAAMRVLWVFLPVLGAWSYVMIPYLVPEIVLTEYNMERMVPINILWAGAGWGAFWENVLNLILKFLFYLEPTFLSIFVWSAGIAIKDEKIEQIGDVSGTDQLPLVRGQLLLGFEAFDHACSRSWRAHRSDHHRRSEN